MCLIKFWNRFFGKRPPKWARKYEIVYTSPPIPFEFNSPRIFIDFSDGKEDDSCAAMKNIINRLRYCGVLFTTCKGSMFWEYDQKEKKLTPIDSLSVKAETNKIIIDAHTDFNTVKKYIIK